VLIGMTDNIFLCVTGGFLFPDFTRSWNMKLTKNIQATTFIRTRIRAVRFFFDSTV
jgi:hypothetical protein